MKNVIMIILNGMLSDDSVKESGGLLIDLLNVEGDEIDFVVLMDESDVGIVQA
jgi:hypothetical protein